MRLIIRLGQLIFPLLIVGNVLGASPKSKPTSYQEHILPILKSRCVRCHGSTTQEARVRLDNLSTDLVNDRAAAETWHEVLHALNAGEMPPEDEPQLSSEERATLIQWLTQEVKRAIEAGRKTNGRIVMRRLNRMEYQRTMFDLLGLEMDYARDLPHDSASSDGFRNNGLALQMSSLQLEYYLKTARQALERVIVGETPSKVYQHEFLKSNVRNWVRGIERSNQLQRKQAFLATIRDKYPEEGEFLVRVTLTADLKPNMGFPILNVLVGYRPDTQVLFRSAGKVEITSAGEQVHEFRGRLENHPLPVRGQGKFPGLVIMARNDYDDGSPLPKKAKGKKGSSPLEEHLPTIRIQSVTFQAPVFQQWPPQLHRRILFHSDLKDKDELAYVTEVLKRFMSRAFRRPVKPSEVERMTNFFLSARREFPTFEEALRETLALVLIQPHFLYLIEPAGDEKRSINDWELASRLSYFLWGTMPDEKLRELASQGTLHQPSVLLAEVDRMIQHPKSSHFVKEFTNQWLHLDVVDNVAVDSDYYPHFREELKTEMKRESQAFFAELLRHNLSALNFLDSRFAMLNEPLAKHYGIEGVFGQAFRRVPLPSESKRGGLLGQASVLLSNSTGSDSHAVRRAVWIRDRLLHDPPAPPPPDVPNLDETDSEFLKLSVREQLKIHRGTGACASCHRGIDPWGIALENFDAVGLWRENVRRRVGKKFVSQPVQADSVLPTGRELNGFADLKAYLVQDQKDQFARALVNRLLTYALGRRLELGDQQAISELHQSLAADNYRLRNLIVAIAFSEPFLTK